MCVCVCVCVRACVRVRARAREHLAAKFFSYRPFIISTGQKKKKKKEINQQLEAVYIERDKATIANNFVSMVCDIEKKKYLNIFWDFLLHIKIHKYLLNLTKKSNISIQYFMFKIYKLYLCFCNCRLKHSMSLSAALTCENTSKCHKLLQILFY